jgi:NAD(P)H-hydrate epimerase
LILDDEDGVISENAADTLAVHTKNADSLVLGPGLGREDTTFRFVQGLLFEQADVRRSSTAGFVGVSNSKAKKETRTLPPMVIDADALIMLSRINEWPKKLNHSCVLTPHPGEMSALTGLPIEEIQSNRLEVARQYAQQWQQTVVLKGALTVIANRDGKTVVIPVATSALAKAGTGDILAGMIGGFLAQGVDTQSAAVAGA